RGPERHKRIGPSVCLPSGRRALRSAPARRFLGPGRASREAKASPSASSSRRLVVAGGGAPGPSRSRACEARQRAPLPIRTPSTPAGRAPRGSRRPHDKAARGAGDKESADSSIINGLERIFHSVYEIGSQSGEAQKSSPCDWGHIQSERRALQISPSL